MKCVVLWQFSLLGVLVMATNGWRFLVCVNASPVTGVPGTTSDSHPIVATPTIASLQSEDNSSNRNKLSPNGTSNVTTTGTRNEDSLEEQLRDDQAALNRMVTILSLIGGLGGIAVVATVIIFTKTRRRRKRELSGKSNSISAEEDGRTTPTKQQNRALTYHQQQTHRGTSSRTSMHSSANFINDQPTRNESTNHTTDGSNVSPDPLISTNSEANSNGLRRTNVDTPLPQPSAPLTIYPVVPTIITTNHQHRRVLSLPSQRQQQPTPVPSAPSAKELDSVRTFCGEEAGSRQASYQGQTEPCYHSGGQSTFDGTNPMTPDLPPPAYTPNPSPLYDGSQQDANVITTVATRAQLTALRRHSQT